MILKLFQRRSIKATLTLFTLTIFVVSIWAMAFYASRTLQDDMQRVLGEQQFSTVSMLAVQVEEELVFRQRMLDDLAKEITPALLGNSAALQDGMEQNEALQLLFSGGAYITGIDGVATSSIPLAAGRIGLTFLDQGHVAAALREGKSTIGQPRIGKALRTMVFGIATPIRDNRGRAVGALVGVTDLSKPNFLDKIAGSRYGETGGYMLVAPQSRTVITATDRRPLLEPLPVPGFVPKMDPFIQGSEGYAVFIEDSGNEMLVSSKIIPSTGWRILALLPTVEAFAPLRSMRARIITAALLATIVVGGLIWWMTSLLLRRQFLPMVSTAKLIKAQSGENQLLRPLPITSEGEVGELISSFNVLLRALESKTIGLLESEKTMRSFFDHAPVGISISTRDGKLIYINPAMPKIMGYDSREEMMEAVSRRSISEVLYLDPGKRDSIIADLDRAGKKWTFFEDRYRTKDDCFVDAEVALGSSLDKVSGKTHIYCIMTDISKRKMAEANLLVAKIAAENANDVKSSFLAATSHDLRQPMQAMSLFNNALGRTGLNEEQKRIRGLLAMAIQSMNDLLNALLNISRLDAGSVKVQDEVVTVDALILKLEAEFPAMAAERSLRFKVRASFRKMVLVTDGKLLASLLGNLIGNAIKYTRRGGILVAIRRRGDRAVIQVWDTGIGIAEKDLGRIFDEYVQIGNSSRDRTKGLGLGLAIARRISILLKSELVCRSRLGKGSVFEISLPLKDPVGIGAPAFGNLAVVDAGSAMEVAGCRIVIVEDDVLVAKATQLLLESLGMRVSSYGSAEEALADSDIADADFYISDFMLAGLNGLEFLNAISQRSKKPVNAVLMTGDTSSERIRIAQSSPWPVLFKPVDLSGLLSAFALHKS